MRSPIHIGRINSIILAAVLGVSGAAFLDDVMLRNIPGRAERNVSETQGSIDSPAY